ncbi:MAG: hypothetical protein A4S12_05975 [Proteobacteria bacterium SG_bin5]|nr:type II secretion system protein M [Sphingomonas sp.]OQW43017.1 MAG: hypothetical protein A4S12_05975 [Proteobacteria bacterium SG_bin5]
MSGLRAWLLGLSPRERLLIGVAGALALIVLLWFGIIRPIGEGLDAARDRQLDAVTRLASVRGAVAAVEPLAKAGAPQIGGSLEAVVRERATAAGFALTSVAPQADNALAIGMASARPAALFAWIAELEAQGILVDQLQTTDNGDRTLSVALTLRARRG